MAILTNQQFIAVGVAGVIGFYLLKGKAGDVASAVNPGSTDNIIYKGVNAIGDVLDDGADDDSFSLGSWFYDLVNDEVVL